MEVGLRVRIHSADAVEIDALYAWLRADTELAADVSVGATNRDEMGGLEIIDLVLTHSVAIGSLAVSVASFLHSRQRPQRTVVTRQDGEELPVDRPEDDTAERIAEFLEQEQAPTDQA